MPLIFRRQRLCAPDDTQIQRAGGQAMKAIKEKSLEENTGSKNRRIG